MIAPAISRPVLVIARQIRRLDHQLADQPLGNTRQRVVDECVLSWDIKLHVNHGSTSRRHRDGLHIEKRRAQKRTKLVGSVENLPDDVET